MSPPSLKIFPNASDTEASESTSIAEIVTGRLSFSTIVFSSGAPLGFRIVAYTLCPALPIATAVASPMPLLVPVMSADVMSRSPRVPSALAVRLDGVPNRAVAIRDHAHAIVFDELRDTVLKTRSTGMDRPFDGGPAHSGAPLAVA